MNVINRDSFSENNCLINLILCYQTQTSQSQKLRSFLESQEALSVSVRYLILIRIANWELVKEIACLCHRTIGIVSREHYPVGSDLKIQIEECLRKVKTAERIVNILSEVVCYRTIKLRYIR